MKKYILIHPSGAENAIELYNSIKDSVDINVIAASGKADISELIYRNKAEYLPYIKSEIFIEALNTLILDRNVHFIFPTPDNIGKPSVIYTVLSVVNQENGKSKLKRVYF